MAHIMTADDSATAGVKDISNHGMNQFSLEYNRPHHVMKAVGTFPAYRIKNSHAFIAHNYNGATRCNNRGNLLCTFIFCINSVQQSATYCDGVLTYIKWIPCAVVSTLLMA